MTQLFKLQFILTLNGSYLYCAPHEFFLLCSSQELWLFLFFSLHVPVVYILLMIKILNVFVTHPFGNICFIYFEEFILIPC